MIIKSKIDRLLSLNYAKQLYRKTSIVGQLTLVYALYELNIDSTLYAVAVSDGVDLAFRLAEHFSAAEELYLSAIENGVDTSTLDAVSDDLLYNNIL